MKTNYVRLLSHYYEEFGIISLKKSSKIRNSLSEIGYPFYSESFTLQVVPNYCKHKRVLCAFRSNLFLKSNYKTALSIPLVYKNKNGLGIFLPACIPNAMMSKARPQS